MLIGQIEQEILEGRFRFLELQPYLDSDVVLDLQLDEAEVIDQLQRSELAKFESGKQKPAHRLSFFNSNR